MIAALPSIPESASFIEHDEEPGRTRPWSALAAEAMRLAAELPGARKRRVYGVQGPNGADTLSRILSVLAAGGIPAPFPPDLPAEVREACLARLGAAGSWTPERGWRALGEGRTQPAGFELVMHSSGSTGVPKPLAIRLAAMERNARDVARALGLDAADRHLGTMSQCYMSGLYNAIFLPWFLGATAVSLPVTTPLTAGAFAAALRRHRPTVLWLNPLIARMLVRLRDFSAALFDSVRFAVACTAPLPAETKAAFEERFARPLLQSYGLCETLITTVEDPARPAAGTVGRPVGDGRPVWLDESGQLVVANGALFAGCLDPAPAEDQLAPPASYATGDLARFDAEGDLVIEGRLSEVINRNGIKFSPESVEKAILAFAPVEDCALIGCADAALGTRLVACVVARAGAAPESIEALLRQRLPGPQRPHEVVFLGRIPRTSSGKVDRPALRRRCLDNAH